MTMLVHLCDARDVMSIRRSGIKGVERTLGGTPAVALAKAVFAMPVLPNFYASHQWLRELKRRGMRSISGVYFRARADMMVYVGRYSLEHRFVPLGHAAGLIMHDPDPVGMQIIIPSSISSKAIQAVREVPQVTGWRYYPDSHKRLWTCMCEYCCDSLKGDIKAKLHLRKLATRPEVNPEDFDDPDRVRSYMEKPRSKATTRKRREDRDMRD